MHLNNYWFLAALRAHATRVAARLPNAYPRESITVLETDRVDKPSLMLVGANFLHCILPLTAVSTGENGRMKVERGSGSWLADEGED